MGWTVFHEWAGYTDLSWASWGGKSIQAQPGIGMGLDMHQRIRGEAGTAELSLWVKGLPQKHDSLSSIQRIHGGKRELAPQNCPLNPTHALWHEYSYTHPAHTLITNQNNKFKTEESQRPHLLPTPIHGVLLAFAVDQKQKVGFRNRRE